VATITQSSIIVIRQLPVIDASGTVLFANAKQQAPKCLKFKCLLISIRNLISHFSEGLLCDAQEAETRLLIRIKLFSSSSGYK
jgi:hypothetical protein